jgi:hypothetical protein
MLKRLGAVGILGLLLMIGGLGVVTWAAPMVGLGLALVFLGTGLIVKALISNLVSSMGMGGMF